MTPSLEREARHPRRRGGVPRIDRHMIVTTAKAFDPETLTMQAVADELGVDRKALNYHVRSKDGLLQLVAVEVFADALLATTTIGSDASWQEAVEAFTRGIRDAVTATGRLAMTFVIDEHLRALEPAEATLQKLLQAGLGYQEGTAVLRHLTFVALGLGRDTILTARSGVHPQLPEILSALRSAPDAPSRFPALHGAAEAGVLNFSDSQFDFTMGLIVKGIESLLSQRRPRKDS